MLALNILCFRFILHVIFFPVPSQKNKSKFNAVWCEICLVIIIKWPQK